MKEEEIRKLAEDYIDSCTKKSGFVILAESLKDDFIDLFVAGFMKCLEINKSNEWHDLEKNPNDLPSKGRLVICYLKEDVFDVGIFKKEIELQCGKERIRKWTYFELPEELK